MLHLEADIQTGVISQIDTLFSLRWPSLMVPVTDKNGHIKKVAPLYTMRNEGRRTPQAGKRAKAQGVRSGVPDLFLAVTRGGMGGLYIELKAPKGRTSTNQAAWIKYLLGAGYGAYVCYSVDEAVTIILEYMDL